MPRFFFDLVDGIAEPDRTGTDFESVGEARRELSKRVAARLARTPDEIWEEGDCTLSVRNEIGLILFSIVVFASLSPAGRRDHWRDLERNGSSNEGQG